MKWIACRVVTLSILVLVCATSVVSFAQDEDTTARAQVLGLEKAWNQAYKAGDIKALSTILDNSLVLVEDDGSLKPSPSSSPVLKRPAPTRNKSLLNR